GVHAGRIMRARLQEEIEDEQRRTEEHEETGNLDANMRTPSQRPEEGYGKELQTRLRAHAIKRTDRRIPRQTSPEGAHLVQHPHVNLTAVAPQHQRTHQN